MLKDLRRHIMMQKGGGGSILPPEYQQVEYIEGMGNQYILFSPQENNTSDQSSYFKRIIFQQTQDNSTGSIWGVVANVSNNYRPDQVGCGNGNYRIQGVWRYVKVARISFGLDKWDVTYENDSLIANGVTYTFENTSASWTTSVTRGLFAGDGYGFKGKLFYFEDDAGRVMYPCYRKSDNKPGMYNIGNDKFYVNSGTGEFIIGPNSSIVYE